MFNQQGVEWRDIPARELGLEDPTSGTLQITVISSSGRVRVENPTSRGTAYVKIVRRGDHLMAIAHQDDFGTYVPLVMFDLGHLE